MLAAVLRSYGAIPELSHLDEPTRDDGAALVEVTAAALNPVDLTMASGSFHGGVRPLPYVVGQEGIGRIVEGGRLAAGTRVYFDEAVPPCGSLAERAAVREESAIEITHDVDDALAVCFGVAGLAAWLPLEWRARLREGERVLVLGASGPVGQIAVQAARLLGAGRVVAAARSADGLRRARELGADASVQIGAVSDLADALREAAGGGFDVVIDPLWGEPAVAAAQAMNAGGKLVQIGQSAAAEAMLLSSDVRGKMIEILGHNNRSAPADVRRAAFHRMVEHAAAGELTVDLETLPLDRIAEAWRRQGQSPHRKLVLLP